MSEENLKACPFCGGEAEISVLGRLSGCCKIKCSQCFIENQYSSVGSATRKWNTRQSTESKKIEEVLSRLELTIYGLSQAMVNTGSVSASSVLDTLTKIKSTLEAK